MPVSPPPSAPPRWLLLIHQLPPTPAYLRVKTARQLQKIGAVAVKNSVYVLPNSEASQESFVWLSKEIGAGGGEATLCESSFVGETSNEAIEALFDAARGKDYQQLVVEVRAAGKALGRARRLDDQRRGAADAALARFRRRLSEIADLDFFGAPGREATTSLLDSFEQRLREPPEGANVAPRPAPRRVRGAVWVTRKGVHVDRIASAWLIKRFIDSDAKLKFVPPKGYAPLEGELRFDMFEAEYTHEGERCTFEVLTERFELSPTRRSTRSVRWYTTSTSATASSAGLRRAGVERLDERHRADTARRRGSDRARWATVRRSL